MREQDNDAMGAIGSVRATTAVPPPGSRTGGPAALTRALLLEPFTRRARLELLFCLVGIPLGLCTLAVPFWGVAAASAVALLAPAYESTWVAGVVAILALLLLIVLATRMGRGLGTVHRRLAARLLDERVAPPPLRAGRGVLGRLGAGLRDGPGWRAVAYQLLKLPIAVVELYAVFLWVDGLANLTYPFWWGLFRNHPPGVRLSPVPAGTPFPGRVFHVGTYPGTFLALAVGTAMVLAAPWVTRAVVAADRRLLHGLLGPGRLAQRVRDLEQTRALAVDDTAVLLRRVERDLHDGAQIRLATLAMHLGMAREKLAGDPDQPDLAAARELVDAAHREAKGALAELRDLARGIHPPALDNGLADALATIAASSAIPVELTSDIPQRPTPAIETIAYFCAAELLANAAKHSNATTIRIRAAGRDGMLLLSVSDDGTGGADPAGGSGLAGLAQRVRTVDGRLEISSPPGGPTRITAELPLRA
jgi:signal transduction histidine kinase